MIRVFFLLIVLTLLFMNSSQTYEQQTLMSTLEKWLAHKPFEAFLSILYIPYWGTWVSIEERGYYPFVEFLIRKGAHIISFAALALAFYWALPRKSPRFILAFLCTLAFAIIDELHQSSIPGRTAYYGDILLDAAGAAIALMILYIIKKKAASKMK